MESEMIFNTCLFSSHSLAKESSFVPGRNLEKYELCTNLDQVLICIGTLQLQFEFLISDNIHYDSLMMQQKVEKLAQ